MASRNTLYTTDITAQTIERLLQLIAHSTEPCLPSVAQLCKTLDVGRRILLRALGILRDQGVVRFHQGQRIRIAHNCAASSIKSPRLRQSSSALLEQALIDDVGRGLYKPGEVLPKLEVLARKFRVSTATVVSACSRLLDKGFLRRRGRQFEIGLSLMHRGMSAAHRSALLVVVRSEGSWRALCSHERFGPFAVNFISEAEKIGVRLHLAPTQNNAHVNIDTALSAIGSLYNEGIEVRGALVVGAQGELSAMRPFFDVCRDKKLPIVWFDQAGSGWGESALQNKYVYRCYIDETSVARAAVDALAWFGHRKAVFFQGTLEPWQQRRYSLLHSIGATYGVAFECLTAATAPMYLSADTQVLSTLRSLVSLGNARLDAAFFCLIKDRSEILRYSGDNLSPQAIDSPYAGFLALAAGTLAGSAFSRSEWNDALQTIWNFWMALPFLIPPYPTALVVCNDWTARTVALPHLHKAGMAVPRSVSVLSFDNVFRVSFVPLSTIDFGCAGLGYQAFHALLGDITIKYGSDNSIVSSPVFVDRGTLVPVRESLD